MMIELLAASAVFTDEPNIRAAEKLEPLSADVIQQMQLDQAPIIQVSAAQLEALAQNDTQAIDAITAGQEQPDSNNPVRVCREFSENTTQTLGCLVVVGGVAIGTIALATN
ncbi:hypothetical protein NHF45_12855 [Maricaulaceae bacterium NA33B04]|nr:hypothetical protein [Maricaulaceae bacterium NA33B04]